MAYLSRGKMILELSKMHRMIPDAGDYESSKSVPHSCAAALFASMEYESMQQTSDTLSSCNSKDVSQQHPTTSHTAVGTDELLSSPEMDSMQQTHSSLDPSEDNVMNEMQTLSSQFPSGMVRSPSIVPTYDPLDPSESMTEVASLVEEIVLASLLGFEEDYPVSDQMFGDALQSEMNIPGCDILGTPESEIQEATTAASLFEAIERGETSMTAETNTEFDHNNNVGSYVTVDSKEDNNGLENAISVEGVEPVAGVSSDDSARGDPPRKKRKTKQQVYAPQKACGESCKKSCYKKVTETQRQAICEGYNKMDQNEKRVWIFHNVSRLEKHRDTTSKEHRSRRSQTFKYKLTDDQGVPQDVCKKFFLTTLGYNPKNDRLITTVMSTSEPSGVTPGKDMRGRKEPPNKIVNDPINDHIESFNPCISHFRREHAPNRRYLPSDVTIRMMYGDYKEKHKDCSRCPNKCHCCYETYRKVLREKKISFTKLGEEQCEHCLEQELHAKAEGHTIGPQCNLNNDSEISPNTEDCQICTDWRKHKENAEKSRKHYQDDALNNSPADYSVRSVDLQKVIMLPRMPGNKTSVFTRRIVAFHETFATIGKKSEKKNKKKTISVLWHEGIAGRKAEEITSAYITALEAERDAKHAIFWMDNCTAQNKNWCLLTTLVIMVNSDDNIFEDITFKFFESGHTFMSADSFHHGVEREMKNRPNGNVFDFPDFVDVVKNSNSCNVDVIQLTNEKVRAWKSGQSLAKVKKAGSPKLANMVEIQFRRGYTSLFYKTDHDEDMFAELDFLMKKVNIATMPAKLRAHDRGIPQCKKRDIINKLCPMMPSNRRKFWQDLVVDDNSVDLQVDED